MCAPLYALLSRTTVVHSLRIVIGEVYDWETTRCGAQAQGDCGDTSLPTTRDPKDVTCKRCLTSYRSTQKDATC